MASFWASMSGGAELVDMEKVYVKPDAWGGAGAFARVPIKKGDLVEKVECNRMECSCTQKPLWGPIDGKNWEKMGAKSDFGSEGFEGQFLLAIFKKGRETKSSVVKFLFTAD